LARERKRSWHDCLQMEIKRAGEELGFEARMEKLGEITFPFRPDCVWLLRKPWDYIVAAFEIESYGPSLHNIAKYVSLGEKKPWIVMQICKNELDKKSKEEKIKGYEEFAKLMPMNVKIIHGVGKDDVKKTACKIVAALISYIKQNFNLSDDFVERYINYTEGNCNEWVKSHRILRIGEEKRYKEDINKLFNHDWLSAEEQISPYIVKLAEKIHLVLVKGYSGDDVNLKNLEHIREKLSEYDVFILNDISLKNKELYRIVEYFLREHVEKEGKTLIVTGGYGLTKSYDVLLKDLGWKIHDRVEGKRVRLVFTEEANDIKVPGKLVFRGYNRVKVSKDTIVWARWGNKYEGDVALAYKEYGKGRVIIFTSDCTPFWGGEVMTKKEFRELWYKILRKSLFK